MVKQLDRIKDSTTTTGTGSLTLSGTAPTGGYAAVTAANGFAANDTFNYAVSDQSGNNWETGQCTIASLSPTVLTRPNGTSTFPYGSSNTTTGSITTPGATNASPIVITSTAHGLSVGQYVTITGVGGNTAANGYWIISATTTNTFTIQYPGNTNSIGNGAWTSGGTWVAYGLTSFTAGTKDVILTVSSPNLVSLTQRNIYNVTQQGGPAGLWTVTQNQPNAIDQLDNVWDLVWTINASSAVNELAARVLTITATNTLTGGGHVQNLRPINLNVNTSASTTTDFMDYVYLDAGTASGTVTTCTGIRMSSSAFQGTNQCGININPLGGTNNTNILLGADVSGIPSGAWSIYSSSAGASWLAGALSIGATPNEAAAANTLFALVPPAGVQPSTIVWSPTLSPTFNAPIASQMIVNTNTPYISGLADLGGVANIETNGTMGVQGAAVGDFGTCGGFLSITTIANCAAPISEPICWLGAMSYQSSNLTDCHTPNRGWFTDFNLAGAVGVQQSALSGVTMCYLNSYYGPTYHGEAAAFAAIANPSGGAAGSFEHIHAPGYAGWQGVLCQGYSTGTGPLTVNSGTLAGWAKGVQVGGFGGNWGITRSHIHTGVEINDCSNAGLLIRRTYNGVTGVVLTQKVVSATIGAAGAFTGTTGTFTVTGTTGTGTKFTASCTLTNGSGITAVLSILTGGNYTVPPTSPDPVTAANLTGATLNVVLGTNNGAGYTSTPTLAIGAAPAGGVTAVGVPYLTGTTVASITVTAAGQGFTSLPTLVLDNPFPVVGGVVATATVATMKAVLAGTTIGAGGSGYGVSQTFNATVVGGTFSAAAVVNVTCNAGGVVTTVNSITTAGSYTVLPALPAATTGGAGSGLTLNVSFGILAVTVVNAGSGYGQTPNVTIVGGGGSGATLTPVFAATTLAGFIMSEPGMGYTAAPTATVTGGGGSTQALAACTIGSAVSGCVTGVLMTNEGAGYGGAVPPAITFTGGGGAGASGQAVVNTEGRIVGVMMTNFGSGYTTPPTVAFATTNAQATAVCKVGALTAPVSAGGSNYAVGDILQISGGTSNPPAQLKVATLSGSAVATVTIQTVGNYSSLSGVASPAATTAVTGVGSGATFTMTWKVVDIHITNVGGYYTSAPTAAFTPASTTVCTPTIDFRGILKTAYPITNAGSYTTANGVPTIAFSTGLSAVTGATGTAIMGGLAMAINDDAGPVVIGDVNQNQIGGVIAPAKLSVVGTNTFGAASGGGGAYGTYCNTALIPNATNANENAQIFGHTLVSDAGVAAGGFALNGITASFTAGCTLGGGYNKNVNAWVGFHVNAAAVGSGTIGTELGFWCDALRAGADFGIRIDGPQANAFGGPTAFAGNAAGFAFTPTAAVDIQWSTAITTALNSINNTVTWNAGGVVFTNWLMNVTNTASAAGSKLVDLQVGGASQFSVDKTGLLTSESRYNAILTASQTLTASMVTLSPTTFSFPIAANEQWEVDVYLPITGTANGCQFQLTGPASPTTVSIITDGTTTAATARSFDQKTAFASASGTYCTVAATGFVRIHAAIVNGVNAGTIAVQGVRVTSGSPVVLLGAYLHARRVA